MPGDKQNLTAERDQRHGRKRGVHHARRTAYKDRQRKGTGLSKQTVGVGSRSQSRPLSGACLAVASRLPIVALSGSRAGSVSLALVRRARRLMVLAESSVVCALSACCARGTTRAAVRARFLPPLSYCSCGSNVGVVALPINGRRMSPLSATACSQWRVTRAPLSLARLRL